MQSPIIRKMADDEPIVWGERPYPGKTIPYVEFKRFRADIRENGDIVTYHTCDAHRSLGWVTTKCGVDYELPKSVIRSFGNKNFSIGITNATILTKVLRWEIEHDVVLMKERKKTAALEELRALFA